MNVDGLDACKIDSDELAVFFGFMIVPKVELIDVSSFSLESKSIFDETSTPALLLNITIVK